MVGSLDPHDQPLNLVEGRIAREQRRGVPILAEAEDGHMGGRVRTQHLPQLPLVGRGIAGLAGHAVDSSANLGQQGFVGHPEVGIRVIGWNAPFVSEEDVDLGPPVLELGKALIAATGRRPSSQCNGPRRDLEEEGGGRRRQIIDDSQLSSHGNATVPQYPGVMGLEVRGVRPEEHEAAGAVTALAYKEFGRPDENGWDDYRRRVADVASRVGRTLVLVAMEDGRILGTVTLELEERVQGGHERPPLAPDEACVRMLGVDPEARGRGVGRRLMRACIDEARRAGKVRLTLDTTEQMKAAQHLYESMGFRRGPDQVFDDGFRLRTYELSL